MVNIIYDMLPWGREGNSPSKIVIHAMGEKIDDGEIYEARDFLDKLELSAHFLIKPDGDVIQCRAENQTAYHARGHNTNSIGIEFLVEGEHNYGTFLKALKTDWCNTAQYTTGIELVRDLIAQHGDIMVIRHSDLSPGRKVDPGEGFHWEYFTKMIKITAQ